MNGIMSARLAFDALMRAILPLADIDRPKPTPCNEFSVATLVDHLVTTVAAMAQDVGFDSKAETAASPQVRIAAVIPPVLDAWERRGETGDVVLRGRDLPARLALGILALEMTVHGWDFANAVRAKFAIADDHAEHLLAIAHQTLTPESRRIAGFNDPLPTEDNASALNRLIAFTGRDPSWSPHSLTSGADGGRFQQLRPPRKPLT
jgi:uncharacterized protein (TIGR03086 family)